MSLGPLSLPGGSAETDTAQRFLASAFEAVDGVLNNLREVRERRKERGGSIRGRLTANEEDLLRAAILFTGAGLDATLKQLIRDALPVLLESNDQAHDKFERFAAERFRAAGPADGNVLARYLTSDNPRRRLIEDYIYAMARVQPPVD